MIDCDREHGVISVALPLLRTTRLVQPAQLVRAHDSSPRDAERFSCFQDFLFLCLIVMPLEHDVLHIYLVGVYNSLLVFAVNEQHSLLRCISNTHTTGCLRSYGRYRYISIYISFHLLIALSRLQQATSSGVW